MPSPALPAEPCGYCMPPGRRPGRSRRPMARAKPPNCLCLPPRQPRSPPASPRACRPGGRAALATRWSTPACASCGPRAGSTTAFAWFAPPSSSSTSCCPGRWAVQAGGWAGGVACVLACVQACWLACALAPRQGVCGVGRGGVVVEWSGKSALLLPDRLCVSRLRKGTTQAAGCCEPRWVAQLLVNY